MPTRRTWPLRWWHASFAAAVAFPLLILLSWLFVSQVQREEKEARDTALRIARAAATRLQGLHRDSVIFLRQMALRPAVREFDGKNCDSLFAMIDFFPQYANLLMFDSDGHLV